MNMKFRFRAIKVFGTIITLSIFLVACKKNNDIIVTGTVISKGGCSPNGWLIEIDNPDPGKYNFLCPDKSQLPVSYSCQNSVHIINMSQQSAIAGKKIKFSIWDRLGSCQSSSYAPQEIQVFDLSVK